MELLRKKKPWRNEKKDGYLLYVDVQRVQLETENKDTDSLTNLHFLRVISKFPHARVGAENYLQISEVLISK